MIGLGLALLAGGGRRGAARLALVVAGVAAGVTLVLATLAIGPARDAENRRVEVRMTPPSAPATDPRPALLWDASRSGYGALGERQLTVIEVAATGSGAPAPLGASRIPRPGEVFVSPALARVLEGPAGRVYRLRFPGRVDGRLGRGVLHDPDELVAMVGLPPDRLLDAARVTGWDEAGDEAGSAGSTFNRRLVYLLAAIGILVPIVVFVAASARVGASTRDRRYAAMRLAGATPRQVAAAAAVESGAAGLLGALLGLAAALLIRTQAASLNVAGYSTFPADLHPAGWEVALVVLGTPILTAVAAMAAMRRIAISPLGVRRRQPTRRPSARRLAPLGVAWLELALAVRLGDRLSEDGKLAALGIGFAGVILAIVYAGPWLVGVLASVLAGAARGPGGLIAGRRLEESPATAFRAIGGAVLGVFAATAVLVYLPSHDRWASRDAVASGPLPTSTVDATVEVFRNGAPVSRTDRLAAELAGLAGVRRVLPAADVPTIGARMMYATCADAAAALHLSNLHCPPGGVLADATTGLTRGQWITVRGRRLRVVGMLPPGFPYGIVAPPRAAPAPRHPTEWIVQTDGSLAAAQRLRAAQTGSGLLGMADTAAAESIRFTLGDPLRRQALLVLLLMLAIAGSSLAVMMVEGIVERRRELAMLAAAGARPGQLRLASALEVIVPLGLAAVASCAVGVVVTATLLRVRGIGLVMPWADLGQLLLVTVLVGAGVLALGLPLLGRIVRAETLRTE